MRPSRRWVLVITALACTSTSLAGTVSAAAAPAAGSGGSDGALLGTLDYQAALVTPEQLADVPGFAPAVPFLPESTPLSPGEALPTFCGGEEVEVLGGYAASINDRDGEDLAGGFNIAAVDNPKAYLKQVRREVAGCGAPYPSGTLTLIPETSQPGLEVKPRKLGAVLATTIQSSGNAVFQIAVRRSNVDHFVAYIGFVAEDGVIEVTTQDLDALTGFAVKSLDKLDRLLDQARASEDAE
jgi:hypothetical protein